jgi:hypothetical protein
VSLPPTKLASGCIIKLAPDSIVRATFHQQRFVNSTNRDRSNIHCTLSKSERETISRGNQTEVRRFHLRGQESRIQRVATGGILIEGPSQMEAIQHQPQLETSPNNNLERGLSKQQFRSSVSRNKDKIRR